MFPLECLVARSFLLLFFCSIKNGTYSVQISNASSNHRANQVFGLGEYSNANALKRKVRVNVLYLGIEPDAPMLRRTTFAAASNKTETHQPTLGAVYPGSAPWLANDLLQNVEVHILYRDTKYDETFNLQSTFSTLLGLLVTTTPAETDSSQRSDTNSSDASSSSPAIHFIVGPSYSSEVKAVSQLTSFYNLVMISGAASSTALSDRSRYPNFFRTCASDADGPDVLANVVNYFGYNQLNALYQDEVFILDLRETLEPNLRARGIRMESSFIFGLHNNRSYVNMAEVLSTRAASHVLLLLAVTEASQYEVLCALSKFGGITGSKYLLIMYGARFDARWFRQPTPTVKDYSNYLYLNQCSVEQISEVVSGALHISQGDADSEDRLADVGLKPSTFRRAMLSAYAQDGKSVDSFYTYLYMLFDALNAAALALDRTEQELQERYNTSLAYFHYNDSRVVKHLFQHLSNMSFQGLTGRVEFASTGDRKNSGWNLRQVQGSDFVDVARYVAKNATEYEIVFQHKLIFPTEDGKPPPQFPPVKSWATPLNILIVAAAAALVILLVPLMYYNIRRRMNESALQAALANAKYWLIEQDALTADDGLPSMMLSSTASSNISLSSSAASHIVLAGSSRTLTSDKSRRMQRPFLSYKHDGIPVCLFRLQPLSPVTPTMSTTTLIDREFVGHLLSVQLCSHDNLTRFVGVVDMLISDSRQMYVIMAGSTKGTLSEFLAESNDDEMELDETCSFSFLRDLQKGLTAIHKQLGCHGRLSSHICTVDSRLSLRISDYGFRVYRQPSFFAPSAASYKYLLWTAPEILHRCLLTSTELQPKYVDMEMDSIVQHLPVTDWAKCDVYSLGIIMSEVFTRSPPFVEQLDSHSEQSVLQSLAFDANKAHEYCKANYTLNKIANDTAELTLRCVSADAAMRPVLADIGASLRSMMKSRKLSDNLTEMLMQRLETYATNLASIVEQRTQALADEEGKVRRLLYQILPASVADALKNGNAVPPQTFDSVSIYFSDIVGFTTISAQSTPLEVVDLLNDLYNAFDQIISKFDVYKVETIGDAYMVVSGLPTPNGFEHARCIARLSLELIDHVSSKFRIRHRPDEQLRLRIGMHSGPCAAGVVGFVMPRYCLFGDTVNTASRMESTGEPLRIHASEISVHLLQDLEAHNTNKPTEFSLTLRGDMEVKGKGVMKTFWVAKFTYELGV